MDTFALGLKLADKLIKDGRLDQFVADRYASWNTGIGAAIINGTATLEDLEQYALNKGEVTDSLTSGRQERLEGRDELPDHIVRKLQTDIFMGKSIRRQG